MNNGGAQTTINEKVARERERERERDSRERVEWPDEYGLLERRGDEERSERNSFAGCIQ